MEFQQKLEIFPKLVKMVDDGEVMEDFEVGGVGFGTRDLFLCFGSIPVKS